MTTASSFYVGLSQNVIGGGGRLHVEQDSLWAGPSSASRVLAVHTDRIEHRGDHVVVVHRRALPPFLSCALPLTDERGYPEAVVSFPIWMRRPIIRALDAAGFDVRRRATWLSLPDPPY